MTKFPPTHFLLSAIALVGLFLACGYCTTRQSTEAAATLPPLSFTMTRASDGKTVTAANYRGKIVLLYFGYTSCTDICPTTLLNISTILRAMGKQAERFRVLFVTVDPDHDTLGVLKRYTAAFASQVVGLRGTPGAIAALAKRYHVSYSVIAASSSHQYEVAHGATVYIFGAHAITRWT